MRERPGSGWCAVRKRSQTYYFWTLHAAYVTSRINSNLKGSTKQFGWLQATATKKYCAPMSSEYLATIRIDKGEDRPPACHSGNSREEMRAPLTARGVQAAPSDVRHYLDSHAREIATRNDKLLRIPLYSCSRSA
jgi:hypothetical protein